MYKTLILLQVLSEDDDVENTPLNVVINECDNGRFVLAKDSYSTAEITNKQMVRELYAAGSDPAFFMLDDEGNKVED